MSRHTHMSDRPFCWILGSGASFQSGIPTGGKLALQWLAEMHKREDFAALPIEQWATAGNLGIAGFDYAKAANYYPWIYQRRYRDYPEEGYAFLESAMDRCEPSYGYAVLAQIMGTYAHKVTITTNFDNLIADALSIYTRIFPLVCGHESLTGYIRANLRRPLVAKIHRDLLLAPLNSPAEIEKLPNEWADALKKIFSRFTPIVIGYGGNDGSLMGFLEEIAPIEGGIFWCHRADSTMDDRIHRVVNHHKGRRVPIAGFDELMLQLHVKLGLPDLLPQVEDAHNKRIAQYRKQFESLNAALNRPAENAAAETVRAPVRKAAVAAVERLAQEKNWWAWQLKAQAESDLTKRDAIYREGLEQFPNSAELLGNYANFLCDERKDMAAAEAMYLRALEANPKHATILGNYANFLRVERKDMAAAEAMYQRALEADPKHANNLANYAGFSLAQGNKAGLQTLENAFDALKNAPQLEAELECAFYRYAHGPVQRHDDALRLARRLILSGTRSPGWDFSMNRVRATQDGHPEAAGLEKLAAVINDVAPAASLDAWPAWKKAGDS